MIIHLGLHKTGTTYLQREVFPYINKEIISDENLSGDPIHGTSFEYEKRNILLHGIQRVYGRNNKIILGLRDKQNWVKSCYNQYVYSGHGGFYSFNKWYDKVFDKRLLDFKGYISDIKCLFDDVFIYDFEDFLRDKKTVIDHMLLFMNLSSDDVDNIVNNLSDKKYNRRLGMVSLQLFRFNNFLKEGFKYLNSRGNI